MTSSLSSQTFEAFTHLPFGILAIRPNYEVVYWNPCLSEWTGIHDMEITGKLLHEYFPSFLEPRIDHKIKDVFHQRRTIVFSSSAFPHVIEAPLDDKTKRILQTTVTPFTNKDTRETFALFTLQDVTESMQYAAENQRLRDRIESFESRMIQAYRERDVIRRLSQKLASLIDVKEAGKVLAKESYQLFQHDAFLLALFDEQEKQFQVIYCEDTFEPNHSPTETEDNSVWGMSDLMQDILDSPYKLINRVKEPIDNQFDPFGNTDKKSRSIMFVPIQWKNKPIGMLSVQSYTPNRFGTHEVEILKTFAEQCGGVLARFRYESELNETQRSIELMFEGSQDGIALIGPLRLKQCNQVFANMFGLTIEECKQRDLTLQLHPEDRGKMIEYNHKRLNGESAPRRYEFRIIQPDGKIVHVDGTFDTLMKGNKIEGIMGYLRDITSQKTIENELRQSQDLYYSLVESLPLGIFRKNKEYKYTFVNEKFQNELGMSADDILGRTDFHILPASIAERTWRSDFEVMTAMEPIESIEEFHYPGESPFYFHTIKIPLHDTEGNSLGLQGMIWDVTDRVRAQETMTRIYKAIDNSSDAIAVYDHSLKNVYYNKTFLDLFGFTMEELDQIGGVERLYVNQDKELEIHKTLNESQSWEGEIEARTKNGKVLPLALRADAVQDENEVVVGRIGIYRDMTRWKKYEEELKKAVQESIQANKAKSEFLANMSHEIRTPMNGIIGMTELALETQLTNEQREYLELVKDSSESLLELINDILDFSKVEAGKLELVMKEFSLRECLSKFIHSIAFRAEQKEIELLYYVAENVPDTLIGDPHRLRQILINLVGNSIKFTHKGEISLWVTVENVDADNAVLTFSVADTGIGIPVEKQKNIFGAFEQGDASTTRKYGGTGLGLAITKRLVELMDGHIQFESPFQSDMDTTDAPGSRFWLSCNFKYTNSSIENQIRKFEPALINLKVIIIQSNIKQTQILQLYLQAWNLIVDIVEDIHTCWAYIDKAQEAGEPYSFVIVDQQGCGAILNEWKQTQNTEHSLPSILLMMTHAKRDETVLLVQDTQNLKYVVKPVSPSDLYNAVSTLLKANTLEEETDANKEPMQKEDMVVHTSSVKVLLAEDNPINQKIVIRTLEKLNYKITVANDGEEAVEHWKKDTFDLILMDVQMPKMDGLQATHTIRDLEKKTGNHIAIIALTAHAMKGDRERCLEAGMDDYLHKPVNPKQLKERVQHIVHSSRHA